MAEGAPRRWAAFNREVIEEFRSTGGRVERFGDTPVVVVHTVHGETVRPVPLVPVFDDGRTLLFATNAGATVDPAWVRDLMTRPDVAVEHRGDDGITTTAVTAHRLGDDEAAQLLERRAANTPQLAAYLESAAPRAVPVFRLDPPIAPAT